MIIALCPWGAWGICLGEDAVPLWWGVCVGGWIGSVVIVEQV